MPACHLPQAFDGTRILLELLDFMAVEQKSLSSFLKRFLLLPAGKACLCPWDQKGKVMRRLVDEAGGAQVEADRRFKGLPAGGWALVLPIRSSRPTHYW